MVDEESLLANPSLGDVGAVSELPDCHYCGREARYDAIVEINGAKGGANLCGDRYLEHGSGTLGASGDSYLMLESDVPQWFQKSLRPGSSAPLPRAEIRAYDLAVMEHSVRDLVESSLQAAVVRVEENRRRVAVAEQKLIDANAKKEAFLAAHAKLC